MTSTPDSGSEVILLDYRPLHPETPPPAALAAEPDSDDPIEVQAFALMRSGRADEALALLEGELGRARAATSKPDPAPPAELSGSWSVAAPALEDIHVRSSIQPDPGSALDEVVARRPALDLIPVRPTTIGPTPMGPTAVAPALAVAGRRRPAMWAVGLASVALAILAGALWPTSDNAATGGLGTLALETRPAEQADAKAVSAPAAPSAPVTTGSLAVTDTAEEPTAAPTLQPAQAPPPAPSENVKPAATASIGEASDANAADPDGPGAPPAEMDMASIDDSVDPTVPLTPFTPKPRPSTPPNLAPAEPEILAATPVAPRSAARGKPRDTQVAATPRARNRAAAQAYAQKRRAAAEKAAGRRAVPLIGDGARTERSAGPDRFADDGPVILLGGRGLP